MPIMPELGSLKQEYCIEFKACRTQVYMGSRAIGTAQEEPVWRREVVLAVDVAATSALRNSNLVS